MVEYNVKWSDPAENDLADIYLYFAEQALVPAAGARLVEKIRSAGDALPSFPYCPFYDKELGIRKNIVGHYLILFTIDEDKKIVNIRQVADGRRDLTLALR
jgi:plasmid stabilization system protein ParE